jgi:DHA2 family multidrug resistance protein-like MFS transporter
MRSCMKRTAHPAAVARRAGASILHEGFVASPGIDIFAAIQMTISRCGPACPHDGQRAQGPEACGNNAVSAMTAPLKGEPHLQITATHEPRDTGGAYFARGKRAVKPPRATTRVSQARTPQPAHEIHPDGLPVPRRYWAVVTIVLAIAMSVLDSTIANIALPTIARDFAVSPAESVWVINAYQLAILISLLPLASLGEIVGYRRVSQTGLIVFTLASLACVFAPSLLTLSIARVIQGFGAAGIMSVNPALVRFTYPSRMLGRALGINAMVVATSAALGPTIASAILSVGHWRWLFALNVPIGVVAACIATFALPYTERVSRKLNWVGAALHVVTFGLLITGLQAFAHDAATSIAAGQLLAGCVMAAIFVRHEWQRPAPLIPFDLLRIRIFRLSLIASVCSFTAQMAAFVALPFEIQRLGWSAVETGLLMTPWPVGVAIAAPIAGRLADRYPAGILGGVGLLMNAASLLLIAFLPEGSSAFDLAWRMALSGLGFGFFQSPNNRAMLSSVPRARSGAAGGMLATMRLTGQTLGAAGVALLFSVHSDLGSNQALLIAAGIGFVAALVSMARLVGDRQAPAH